MKKLLLIVAVIGTLTGCITPDHSTPKEPGFGVLGIDQIGGNRFVVDADKRRIYLDHQAPAEWFEAAADGSDYVVKQGGMLVHKKTSNGFWISDEHLFDAEVLLDKSRNQKVP